MRRILIIWVVISILLFMLAISAAGSDAPSLIYTYASRNVISKTAGDSFVVSITFRNTGKSVGKWSVSIAIESLHWTWAGSGQNLTLDPLDTKMLAWTGVVPMSADSDSMGRLIVYYNDSFVALNWWIRVVPGAQLSIAASTVN